MSSKAIAGGGDFAASASRSRAPQKALWVRTLLAEFFGAAQEGITAARESRTLERRGVKPADAARRVLVPR